MLEAEKSNSSKDFFTGKPAALSRAAAMEASRAATSASTRARSRSSGAQRWALASWSSSGASRRTVASLSRRSPASKSAGRAGAVVLMTPRPSVGR